MSTGTKLLLTIKTRDDIDTWKKIQINFDHKCKNFLLKKTSFLLSPTSTYLLAMDLRLSCTNPSILTVKWTPSNKIQWNLNQNPSIFCQQNASEVSAKCWPFYSNLNVLKQYRKHLHDNHEVIYTKQNLRTASGQRFQVEIKSFQMTAGPSPVSFNNAFRHEINHIKLGKSITYAFNPPKLLSINQEKGQFSDSQVHLILMYISRA